VEPGEIAEGEGIGGLFGGGRSRILGAVRLLGDGTKGRRKAGEHAAKEARGREKRSIGAAASTA